MPGSRITIPELTQSEPTTISSIPFPAPGANSATPIDTTATTTATPADATTTTPTNEPTSRPPRAPFSTAAEILSTLTRDLTDIAEAESANAQETHRKAIIGKILTLSAACVTISDMFTSFNASVNQTKGWFPSIFNSIVLSDLSPHDQIQVNQLKQRIDLAIQVHQNLDLGECFAELSGVLAKQLNRNTLPEDPVLQRITDRLNNTIANLREQVDPNRPGPQVILADEADIDNAISMRDEIKNLRDFLRRMQPPTMPMAFEPPSRFRTVVPGKERDPVYWNKILKTFWNVSEMEEYVFNGVPVLIHRDGRQHLPIFFSMSDTGSLVVAGNKRVLAAAIVHHEFDELPEA